MPLKSLKAELDQLGVVWRGVCFEKTELVTALEVARAAPPPAPAPEAAAPQPQAASTMPDAASDAAEYAAAYAAAFERASGLKVKEIRTELAGRRIGWADLNEKHELAARLATACAQAAMFSRSGAVSPGTASEVTGDELREEMLDDRTPLLLDVYATWCGPCKLVAPALQALAEKFGGALRVAKLDSDAQSQMASELRVQGLPTILFFRNGREVSRVEGVPNGKDALEKLVREHLALEA